MLARRLLMSSASRLTAGGGGTPTVIDAYYAHTEGGWVHVVSDSDGFLTFPDAGNYTWNNYGGDFRAGYGGSGYVSLDEFGMFSGSQDIAGYRDNNSVLGVYREATQDRSILASANCMVGGQLLRDRILRMTDSGESVTVSQKDWSGNALADIALDLPTTANSSMVSPDGNEAIIISDVTNFVGEHFWRDNGTLAGQQNDNNDFIYTGSESGDVSGHPVVAISSVDGSLSYHDPMPSGAEFQPVVPSGAEVVPVYSRRTNFMPGRIIHRKNEIWFLATLYTTEIRWDGTVTDNPSTDYDSAELSISDVSAGLLMKYSDGTLSCEKVLSRKRTWYPYTTRTIYTGSNAGGSASDYTMRIYAHSASSSSTFRNVSKQADTENFDLLDVSLSTVTHADIFGGKLYLSAPDPGFSTLYLRAASLSTQEAFVKVCTMSKPGFAAFDTHGVIVQYGNRVVYYDQYGYPTRHAWYGFLQSLDGGSTWSDFSNDAGHYPDFDENSMRQFTPLQ